jgi:AcrR family transcriptional regulator
MTTPDNGDSGPLEARTGVRRGLVQQQIFEQATRLFAQRGYAGTSLQDVADAVGLTRPALYHYFSNKDELLARLVSEVTAEAATGIGELARRSDLSADRKVREIVQNIVRSNGLHAERFQLLIRSEADLPEEVRAIYEMNRKSVLRSLTQVIEDGLGTGVFRPQSPRLAALGVLGVANWVAWWYRPDSRFNLDQVSEELAEFAVHGLAAESGRPVTAGPLDVLRGLRHEMDRLEELLKDEH